MASRPRGVYSWEVHGRGWLTRAPPSRVCHLVRRGVLSQCCMLQACGTSACVFDEKEAATVASQFRQSCCAILREHYWETARASVMRRVVYERMWSWILKRKDCSACGASCLVSGRKHATWVLDFDVRGFLSCGASCLLSFRKRGTRMWDFEAQGLLSCGASCLLSFRKRGTRIWDFEAKSLLL